jgi:hypothetical protein
MVFAGAPVAVAKCRTEKGIEIGRDAATTETEKIEGTGEHIKVSLPCVRGTCCTFRTKALSGLKTIYMLNHRKLSHIYLILFVTY